MNRLEISFILIVVMGFFMLYLIARNFFSFARRPSFLIFSLTSYCMGCWSAMTCFFCMDDLGDGKNRTVALSRTYIRENCFYIFFP